MLLEGTTTRQKRAIAPSAADERAITSGGNLGEIAVRVRLTSARRDLDAVELAPERKYPKPQTIPHQIPMRKNSPPKIAKRVSTQPRVRFAPARNPAQSDAYMAAATKPLFASVRGLMLAESMRRVTSQTSHQ